MLRLNDADVLKDVLFQRHVHDDEYSEPILYYVDAIESIDDAPAVDAAPVVHGRWKADKDYFGDVYYICSNCGCNWWLEDGTPEDNTMNYCPECGAKMDGGDGDEID